MVISVFISLTKAQTGRQSVKIKRRLIQSRDRVPFSGQLGLAVIIKLGPVVQSVVSLTSSLRVISLTVLVDSIYNILIFFAEKM